MMLRPTRNIGLKALVALLLLLTGVAIWLGASVPDPKSCLSRTIASWSDPAVKATLPDVCRKFPRNS